MCSSCLFGVKIIYDKQELSCASNAFYYETVRERNYGEVKRALRSIQLKLEKSIAGSFSIISGRCEMCNSCMRSKGRSCMKPHCMRYSFSAFCFDLGKSASEELGTELKWSAEGLPEYNFAMCAMLLS